MAKVEISFASLGLNKNIVRALADLGYVKPFLIQEKCIPILLNGDDVLGLAQTGSGKTAAFILPLLHNIDLDLLFPQVLILVPTRELAIQISDVCVNFSKYICGVNVVSLYGGQNYEIQFRALRKGPQVVVGTPGRLLDHLHRSTLCLSKLRSLVIDEADEMLRMGFIEDVQSIILKIPGNRQTALFSATLPKEICRISSYFMNTPQKVYIGDGSVISSNIQQNYWVVSDFHKKEALMRFLEVEDFDAAIVFVRTKSMTLEISNMLEEHGYNSAALNGDMNQIIRQKTIERLKNGQLSILIATDVAARGLDLERITLVVNYDAPINFKSYIHRIGRTGRAGRIGRSLLFIKHSEYRLLRYIERSKGGISRVDPPSSEILTKNRLNKFSEKVKQEWMNSTDLDEYRMLLSEINPKEDVKIEYLAAILLKIAQGRRLLVLPSEVKNFGKKYFSRNMKVCHDRWKFNSLKSKKEQFYFNDILKKKNNMDLYRIDIGKDDGIKVHHILGAIANKGSVNIRKYIGNVRLFSSHAIVELSKSIPDNLLLHFTSIRILNKRMNVKCLGSASCYRKSRPLKLGINKNENFKNNR